jgi:hypothetical protein
MNEVIAEVAVAVFAVTDATLSCHQFPQLTPQLMQTGDYAQDPRGRHFECYGDLSIAAVQLFSRMNANVNR